MEKIIDAVVMFVYLSAAALGGQYALHQMASWSQRIALEKAAKGLGRLELMTRKMTGGKLDF